LTEKKEECLSGAGMIAQALRKQPKTALLSGLMSKKSLSSMNRCHVITVGIDDGRPNLLPV
jgi:hypothetical protein